MCVKLYASVCLLLFIPQREGKGLLLSKLLKEINQSGLVPR